MVRPTVAAVGLALVLLGVAVRRWSGLVAAFLVASACGGGDSGGGDNGLTAATSDGGLTTATVDGVVVTLDVPEGAVPDGTEIEITAGDVPAELAQISHLATHAFDLEPSGLVFSDPATITFRLSAPGATGTPPALVVIEGSEGAATYVSTDVTRVGDEVEVSALVDHFSVAYLVLVEGTEVILDPAVLRMRVGESDTAEVLDRASGERHFSQLDDNRSFFLEERPPEELLSPDEPVATRDFSSKILPAGSGFISTATGYFRVTVTCLKPTDGVIENAYEAKVTDTDTVVGGIGALALVWLADDDDKHSIRLLGDVECVAAGEATTTSSATETTIEPPTESEGAGDQENAESEKVAAGEGVPPGDIESDPRYVLGDSGEHCFIVDVVGDGETVATTVAAWYDVIVSVKGPDGTEWQANVAYFGPTPTDRGVRVGPPAPGQQTLEGATVTIAWDDSDTFRVCVDGGETTLGVASFTVSVGVSTAEGTFWDYANGAA